MAAWWNVIGQWRERRAAKARKAQARREQHPLLGTTYEQLSKSQKRLYDRYVIGDARPLFDVGSSEVSGPELSPLSDRDTP